MWCETHPKGIPFVSGLVYNYHMNELKKYVEEMVEHYRLGMEHAGDDKQYNFMKAKWEAFKEINERI
jgi:hypothetical protein